MVRGLLQKDFPVPFLAAPVSLQALPGPGPEAAERPEAEGESAPRSSSGPLSGAVCCLAAGPPTQPIDPTHLPHWPAHAWSRNEDWTGFSVGLTAERI